jgi:hypothetical protein
MKTENTGVAPVFFSAFAADMVKTAGIGCQAKFFSHNLRCEDHGEERIYGTGDKFFRRSKQWRGVSESVSGIGGLGKNF